MVALAVHEALPAVGRTPGVLARLVGIGKTYGTGETAVAALEEATKKATDEALPEFRKPARDPEPLCSDHHLIEAPQI